MKIDSVRAKEIDAYLASHEDAEQGKWPLEIGGEKKILPFYQLPLHLVIYNANNGRLAVDRREWESEHQRLLDGSNPEDAGIIRDMLLDLDKDKTETLKEDLRQKGQMEPGVITHDGVVINGNRRMAIFEELHTKEPTGKWDSMEVVRLNSGVSEKDLWKIEAGLQLSKDKVAEYHPVNEILKIKEGIERGLSTDEVAAAIYAWTANEVELALDRLNLIDNFLEFFGQPSNYGLIKKFGLHEYFIDIQKTVIARAKRVDVDNKELQKRLVCAFALIRSSVRLQSEGTKKKGITHWDIRKLDKVYSDAFAREEFVPVITEAKEPHTAPDEEVIDGFRDAIDVLQMREERDKPLKLIEKAKNALSSIDTDSINTETDEQICSQIKEGLQELTSLIQELTTHLTG